MAEYRESDVETLGKTLRKQASGVRRLAGEILEGDFRSSLLDLAEDYDRQAATIERQSAPRDR
ncbi:MAG TPA: hypothetical protein VHT74_00295 [Acetobacteraceae bacterium]|jgi:hypothetical protein|nr:hypothetical protein [Acetobacteraceae bacterium]